MFNALTGRIALTGAVGALAAGTAIAGSGSTKDSTVAAPASGAAKRACSAVVAIDDTRIDHARGHDAGLLALAKRWRTVASGSAGPAVPAAATVASAIEDAVANGRTNTLEGANSAADRTVHRWAYASCGLPKIDVTAKEYAFTGVPATIAAGDVALSLKNVGRVSHVIALARVNDDVHESLRDILASKPAEMFAKITLGPSSDEVRPGAIGYVTSTLRPGRWLLVDPQAGSDGTPHFARGQAAEMQVSG